MVFLLVSHEAMGIMGLVEAMGLVNVVLGIFSRSLPRDDAPCCTMLHLLCNIGSFRMDLANS